MVIRGHARAGSPAIPAPNSPQHRCQTSGTIAVPHEPKLRNPNYAAKVKEEIDKLLRVGFIRPVKQATWLSPILVVPVKNGKIRVCVDYRKLNAAIVTDAFTLPFTDGVVNIFGNGVKNT